MKSEGVKDVVKFLDGRLKEAKVSMDAAKETASRCCIGGEVGDFYDSLYFEAKVEYSTLLSTKISVEKYMKKLKHQGE